MRGILGKKVGMTQLFDKSGAVIPVTIIEAGPCYVTQVKTNETDKYKAVQPGVGSTNRACLSTSIGWTWGLEKQFQDGRSRLPSVILVRPGTRFLPLWGRWRPGAPTNELWRHEVLLPRDFPLHLRERADENNCYRLIFEALDEAAMSPLALSS